MESQFDHITKVLAQATSRRRALRGIGGGLIGGVLATLGARKAWAADKVDICHVPPGNPANVHLINVSTNAIPAHLRHGDAVCTPGNDDCCFNSSTSTAVCTNLETDATNCGTCGNVCHECTTCVGGACANTCTHFICGVNSAPDCGSGGASGICFCDSDIDGNCNCFDNLACVTFPACPNGQRDCPPGTFCVADTCCGQPTCLAICADSARRAAPTVQSGPTPLGR
jgi:hypothetical protein